MFVAPAPIRILPIATPAAPTPEITIDRSDICLPVMRSAFSSAANVTTAVPCWSSWNTGMSSSSFSASSTSNAPGAAMSSRLKPPKPGAMSFATWMISSVSCVARQMGKASTPANSLNSCALPSITGRAASGPMLPSPSTAEPSLSTATVLRLMVSL